MLAPLTRTLQPDVVVVEAAVAVAGVRGEEVRTLSVLAYFRPKHLTLVCIWGQRDSSEQTKMNVNNRSMSIPMKARWVSTEETISGSSPLPWGHSLLKSSGGRKKNQRQQWSIFVCFFSERRLWSLYLSLGQDKRGSHSCPPSLLPPCSSTPAWWCSGTERYRRSSHRLGCNNTLSSPLAKVWMEALEWGYWRYYWLQMIKETFTLSRCGHPPSGDSVK